MILTPSEVAFDYKKHNTLPPAYLINLSVSFIYMSTYGENNVDWLDLFDAENATFKIKLNNNVDKLGPGKHTINYGFWYTTPGSRSDYGPAIPVFNYTSIKIILNLSDTIILDVSPDKAPFTYTIGGTLPASKLFTVQSENNWAITKNASWLNLPIVSGANAGTFTIGITPTGKPAGVYNDNVTVNDGVTTKVIPVSLTVTKPVTDTDFLFVNPSNLNFGASKGGANPAAQNVELNASGDWTATTDQPWINLAVASGSSSASIVPIAIQNINALEVGKYIANITFSIGDIKKTAVVQLTIYEFITDLLTPGELHFCDDANYISVASGRSDTFMRLDFATIYKSVSFNMVAEIPYFKGVAKKRIGIRPKKIIGNQQLTHFAEPTLVVPYPVLNLSVGISELELFSKNTIQSQNLSNLKFIKGAKPNGNWISDVPRVLYLTSSAYLYFSILTNGVTANKINVTGAVTKTYSFAPIDADFLTVAIPLTDLGNLLPGDLITVEVLEEKITIIIKDEGTEQSFVFWENQWGVRDVFELTGNIAISPKYNRKTNETRKTELTTETNITNVTRPVDFKINTGFVHTNLEVDALDNMLQARNMYLLVNSQWVQVNPVLKKLLTYDSKRDLRTFDLTFTKKSDIMIIFYSKAGWEQNLTNLKITFVEENAFFYDAFYKNYTKPFSFTLDDQMSINLGLIDVENSSNYKVNHEGVLFIDDHFETSNFIIEIENGNLEAVLTFGEIDLPIMATPLSALPFPIINTADIKTHAKSIIGKNYPSVNYNFPMLFDDAFFKTTHYDKFKGLVNSYDGSNHLENSIDEAGDVINQNAMVPLPYLMGILKLGFGSVGKEIIGGFVENKVNQRILYNPKKHLEKFSSNTFESVQFSQTTGEYLDNKQLMYEYKYTFTADSIGSFNIKMFLNLPEKVILKHVKIKKGLETLFYSVKNSIDETITINKELAPSEIIIVSMELQATDIDIELYNNFEFEKSEGKLNIFRNSFSLSEFMPDMTFGAFLTKLKNWQNLKVTIANGYVRIDYIEDAFYEVQFKDETDFEMIKPKRSFNQSKLYKLSYSDSHFIFIDKDGLRSSSNGYRDEDIVEIDMGIKMLPIENREGMFTAVRNENSDFSLIFYDGLNADGLPVAVGSINGITLKLMEIYERKFKKWLQFRLNSETITDKFTAHSLDLFKVNEGRFKYNKKHLYKTIKRTRESEEQWIIEVESETF